MKDWEDIQGYFIELDRQDYEHLINMLPDNSLMAEIGCFRGRSLCSIADIIIRKNITVQAVDLFDKVYSKEYVEPDVYLNRGGMWDDFVGNIDRFGLTDRVRALWSTSLNAANLLSTTMYDLVFIDADHSYEAVKADIEAWWPKVKIGGILAFHDYDHNGRSWPDVHKAIHEKFGQPYFGCYIASVRKTVNGFNTNTF